MSPIPSPRSVAAPGRLRALLAASLVVTLATGCSQDRGSNATVSVTERADLSPAPMPAASAFVPRGETAMAGMMGMMAGAAPSAEKKAGSPAAAPLPPAVARKIVYNAQVTLIVESINSVRDSIAGLIKGTGGYISETTESSNPNAQRQVLWKVRVPVEKFDGFLNEVSRLGELQSSHVDSQDVTEEFYDLQPRIKNKLEEEKRLLKHLSDSTGKLDDILAVEREISRVRGEAEAMQGRLNYLANLSDLSTVTLTVIEVKGYVPPVAPTFATMVARTFTESTRQLVEFGQACVLTFVAYAPWLPLYLAEAFLAFWAVRWVWRHRRMDLFGTGVTPTRE